jgi:putative oxidoreductase
MKLIVLLGRILYSAIFILAVPGHFTDQAIAYAQAHGVPSPHIMVPLAGILALLGGLSVLLGYKTKQGAWLLVLFLVCVTFSMHRYWTFTDPVQKEFQQLMFMKNLSLLGAALLLTHFGSGPLSVEKPAKKGS